MNDKFDELAKSLAQSVTRRAALKRFGVGLAGVALATLGLASSATAQGNKRCVRWDCANWAGGATVYVCGSGKPAQNCRRIGVVDCRYCTNCC